MYTCKLCEDKVPTQKIKKSKMKEILMEKKICQKCYYDINDDYRRKFSTVLNKYKKCVFCEDEARPYGKAPVCLKGACRSKWHHDVELRNAIKDEIENGGLVSQVTVNNLQRIGFKVEITALPDEETFLNGVKPELIKTMIPIRRAS